MSISLGSPRRYLRALTASETKLVQLLSTESEFELLVTMALHQVRPVVKPALDALRVVNRVAHTIIA